MAELLGPLARTAAVAPVRGDLSPDRGRRPATSACDVEPFDTLDRLDLAIDGADQIAPDGWLVKGGGGAHTREKLVAAAADRFVVIADSSKPVDCAARPVPLELLPVRPGVDAPSPGDRSRCGTRRPAPTVG